jgi:hypothetical protein
MLPQTGHRLYVKDFSAGGAVLIDDLGIRFSFLDVADRRKNAVVAFVLVKKLTSPDAARPAEIYPKLPVYLGSVLFADFNYLQASPDRVLVQHDMVIIPGE